MPESYDDKVTEISNKECDAIAKAIIESLDGKVCYKTSNYTDLTSEAIFDARRRLMTSKKMIILLGDPVWNENEEYITCSVMAQDQLTGLNYTGVKRTHKKSVKAHAEMTATKAQRNAIKLLIPPRITYLLKKDGGVATNVSPLDLEDEDYEVPSNRPSSTNKQQTSSKPAVSNTPTPSAKSESSDDVASLRKTAFQLKNKNKLDTVAFSKLVEELTNGKTDSFTDLNATQLQELINNLNGETTVEVPLKTEEVEDTQPVEVVAEEKSVTKTRATKSKSEESAPSVNLKPNGSPKASEKKLSGAIATAVKEEDEETEMSNDELMGLLSFDDE